MVVVPVRPSPLSIGLAMFPAPESWILESADLQTQLQVDRLGSRFVQYEECGAMYEARSGRTMRSSHHE